MRSNDLSELQLIITMHLANGSTFDEIAQIVDRSISNVKQHANSARRRTGAKTLPQLVSIVIAQGRLEWDDNTEARVCRMVPVTDSVTNEAAETVQP